jgi:hypothetical protein
MGLDLGGGSARCLLLEIASGRVASAARRFKPYSPPDVPMGSAFDAEPTWSCSPTRLRGPGGPAPPPPGARRRRDRHAPRQRCSTRRAACCSQRIVMRVGWAPRSIWPLR